MTHPYRGTVVLTAEQRREALAIASRSAVTSGLLTLRANGKQLAAPDIDAMLARAVARERVELEIDLLAYEQGKLLEDGTRERNRNRVRFRDGVMMRLGRTGKGRPFLRDHRQGDSDARGGTVIDSRTEKLADGHYQILQTVRLTEPRAVERALRGLMSSVSIGWHPTGPVHCTTCRAEIFTECVHFPGDIDEEGNEVEWEFQDAELVETSEVPVPGVQTAGVEGIRAALSAAIHRGAAPQEMIDMSKLAKLLGLAATAGEDEISTAVTTLGAERDALREQLREEQKRTAEINARLAAHEAHERQAAEDAWIADGVKSGKVTLGAHEAAMRAFFKLDPNGAKALLAAAPVITPVGQPLQATAASVTALAAAGGVVTPVDTARAALAARGTNYEKAREWTRMFGAPDPDKALARAAQEG